MPLRYTRRILDHLAHTTYRPSTASEAAAHLRVNREDQALLQEAIEQLQEQGRLEIDREGRLRLPSYGDEIVGAFRLNARGFGFVVPDDPCREGDLFIPRGKTRDAISGDRVRAKVIRQAWRGKAHPGRSPFIGQIVEVIERGREHFTGVLFERGGAWFVEPSGRSLYEPVLIRDPHVKGAKAGDEVVIELMHYPTEHYVPEGVIVRVLGDAGRPDVQTAAIIVAHGLRTEFPQAALDQASKASRSFEKEVKTSTEREDLTGTFTFTIDPPDAKDFDDAITISQDETTNEWTLGVHIADVAHFVRRGGSLDEEARARGNSVYLPRMVIPMLPEVLSNGVCSLQEGVPRFTKSAFITLDHRGKVLFQRAAATVISSNKRLTYLEAQALIDGDLDTARKHARTRTDYTDELVETLRQCDRLARILQKRRHRDGMMVLDLPQVELVFDDAQDHRDVHGGGQRGGGADIRFAGGTRAAAHPPGSRARRHRGASDVCPGRGAGSSRRTGPPRSAAAARRDPGHAGGAGDSLCGPAHVRHGVVQPGPDRPLRPGLGPLRTLHEPHPPLPGPPGTPRAGGVPGRDRQRPQRPRWPEAQ
jgi:ribonuclease R